MDLHRDGNKVTGTWSGPLGEGRAITGTWRNGYVELSFVGEWPKESRQGAPGPVNAFLTGWIDGDSSKGRSAWKDVPMGHGQRSGRRKRPIRNQDGGAAE